MELLAVVIKNPVDLLVGQETLDLSTFLVNY